LLKMKNSFAFIGPFVSAGGQVALLRDPGGAVTI
jgi:hypothetical protein